MRISLRYVVYVGTHVAKVRARVRACLRSSVYIRRPAEVLLAVQGRAVFAVMLARMIQNLCLKE